MARRAQNVWGGDHRDDSLASMFEAMRDEGRTKLNSEDVSIGTDADIDPVGLPLPALALRYLFQSSVFPLSRVVQITGEEGSAKSSFLYEIFRWHMMAGGGAVLAENENKDATEFRNAILRWFHPWRQRMVVKPTFSLEGWQNVFTEFVDISRRTQDSANGPGRTVPICFAVDSLMATAPLAEIESVRKEGHASRGHALAANLIARYMRTVPDRIRAYPFTMVGTNHLKPATDARGLPTNNIPGGKAVKFMETFEIEMKKAPGKCDIDLLEYGGLRIKFVCRKNSLGPSRKSIVAELLWWYEDDSEGNPKQHAAWDWDTATVELLISFENVSGKKTIFNRLKEITGITVTSKSRREAYSEILGIPRSDPQIYRMVGAALERRPDILAEVYRVLGITVRQEFQPGQDYRDMLAQAAQAAQERAVREATENPVETMPETAEALGGDDTPSTEEE